MKNQPKKLSKRKKKDADLRKKKPKLFGNCDDCGKEFKLTEMFDGPCPFQSDVYGKDVPSLLCNNCYRERVWSI